jgi:hypothetical protein
LVCSVKFVHVASVVRDDGASVGGVTVLPLWCCANQTSTISRYVGSMLSEDHEPLHRVDDAPTIGMFRQAGALPL